MSAHNGNLRKKLEGIRLYTNQLYYKSYPGKPATNLLPTAEDNLGFNARLGGTPHKFYRIYSDKDTDQQGMYKSLATGHMSENDVVYKTNFAGYSNINFGLHTFSGSSHNSLKLKIGQEYIFSCEVFVSKRHNRTSGLGSVISIKATDQNGKYYGNYDFSKSGTWQVVSIVFTPKLETLVVATSGTSGASGSAGTSGASSLIKTTLSHTAYFWPQESTTSISERSGGYILYKNPQLEKGSLRTQFTRKESPRLSPASLKDISSNKNSFSVSGMSFSSDSQPIFYENSFANLGLTSTDIGLNSSLQVNSTQKKTLEFWFSGSSLSEGISTLFYQDISEGARFTSKKSSSRKQHIYISDKKVHCDLYNEFGLSSSAFTVDSVIDEGAITNVIVSIDMTKSFGKIKFYVNGHLKNSQVISNLQTPTNITLYPFLNTTSTLESLSSRTTYTLSEGGLEVEKNTTQRAFDRGLTVNYKISSYNENGESEASANKKVLINKQNSSISVSWANVREARGFYVYRSTSSVSEFDEASLLIKARNPYFGKGGNDIISFIDDSSIIPKEGMPKSSSTYSKYKLSNTSFYDGSDLKATIGGLPAANTNEKSYIDGIIYKVSAYSRAFDASDALYSYIEGSRDFNLENNTAPYSFSVSSGNSLGGFGGGY